MPHEFYVLNNMMWFSFNACKKKTFNNLIHSIVCNTQYGNNNVTYAYTVCDTHALYVFK